MGAFFMFFEMSILLLDFYVLPQKLEKIIESSNSVLNRIRSFFI